MFNHSRAQAALRGLAFVLVLALPVGLAAAAAAAEMEERAGSFIRSLATQAVESLARKDTSRDLRIQRFRKMFLDHFAVRTIGRFVLGRHWKKATKDERKEYLNLFEDLMVMSYVDRFKRYAGENLDITRTRAENAKTTTVFSQINRPTGRPVTVLWRVGAKGETFKVLDVIVEGASMSQTLRSDFGSIIRQKGGKVSGLIDELRLKTASLKASGQ